LKEREPLGVSLHNVGESLRGDAIKLRHSDHNLRAHLSHESIGLRLHALALALPVPRLIREDSTERLVPRVKNIVA
jgi:hypothetical protein